MSSIIKMATQSTTLCKGVPKKCQSLTKNKTKCKRVVNCKLGCEYFCWQHAAVYKKGKVCQDPIISPCRVAGKKQYYPCKQRSVIYWNDEQYNAVKRTVTPIKVSPIKIAKKTTPIKRASIKTPKIVLSPKVSPKVSPKKVSPAKTSPKKVTLTQTPYPKITRQSDIPKCDRKKLVLPCRKQTEIGR